MVSPGCISSGWGISYSTNSATTVTAESIQVWKAWNYQQQMKATSCGWAYPSYTLSTTTGMSSYSLTWDNWNRMHMQQMPVRPCIQSGWAMAPETPEDVARREAIQRQAEIDRQQRAAQQAEQQRQIAIVKQQASDKARKLLIECLTAEQRATFERSNYFDVTLNDGRRFRIKKGWSHNVFELNGEGKEVRSLCAHPREQVPEFDNMLAQKIWLEHDTDRFLKVANRGPLLIN